MRVVRQTETHKFIILPLVISSVNFCLLEKLPHLLAFTSSFLLFRTCYSLTQELYWYLVIHLFLLPIELNSRRMCKHVVPLFESHPEVPFVQGCLSITR